MDAVRMYHDDGTYTKEGHEIVNEISSTIRAIYDRHCFAGVSPREVTAAICGAATMQESWTMLERRSPSNPNKVK